VLLPHELIDEINVADDELIFLSGRSRLNAMMKKLGHLNPSKRKGTH
jgi:hypothetical protein